METPNVLFYQSDRIRPPDDAEILLLSQEMETEKPYVLDAGSAFLPSDFHGKNVIPPDLGYPVSLDEINSSAEGEQFVVLFGRKEQVEASVARLREKVFVIGNALEMLRNPFHFVKRVLAIRTRMSPHGLVYAPGIATPSNLSILAYSGIDVVDSLRVVMESKYGRFHTEHGSLPFEETRRKMCHCPACEEGITQGKLVDHNSHVLLRELQVCRNAIERRRLRELAERRMLSSPWCVSVMKYLDRRFYDAVEPSVPVTGEDFLALSDASLHRPDVLRFRKRILKRYSKPPSAKVLLLLPCSARKPYSRSKSHRLFKRTIASVRNASVIHEVIVTSPLGLVPRELELFYPAQNYDIPVTGDWSGEERETLRKEVCAYLERNDYVHVIAHLGVERGFLEDILEDAVFTCEDSPTSPSSLQTLRKEISQAVGGQPRMSRRERLVEDLRNLAVFQFGEPGGNLVEHSEIRGRYPNVRVVRDDHLATLVPSRGMLSLTLAGGNILARTNAYRVEIEDFTIKGNVFAVGVTNADLDIREGDDVIVAHEEDVRAVGVARMPAKEMIESRKGEAVRVRHRA